MEFGQTIVNDFDWAVLAVLGLVFVISCIGALYTILFTGSSKRPVAKEFNYLWRARLLSQIFAACCALSQTLRLQALWGPEATMIDGGWHTIALCRAYIALTYGVFEPLFLLLALFACIYSVQTPPLPTLPPLAVTPPPGAAASSKKVPRHPNFNIVLCAVGFTLPTCAAQLVCALFTRIFTNLDYEDRLYQIFFPSYDGGETDYCPPDSDNCAFCTFPLLSTLVSAAFAVCYLLVLWRVTARIISALINKMLIRRIVMLQVLVTLALLVSLACRGVTVLFHPFDLGFEVLRLGHVVATAVLVISMSYVLVFKPIYDSQVADSQIRKLQQSVSPGTPQLTGNGQPSKYLTLPLVERKSDV